MVFTLLAEVWVHNGSPSIRFCECRSIFGYHKKKCASNLRRWQSSGLFWRHSTGHRQQSHFSFVVVGVRGRTSTHSRTDELCQLIRVESLRTFFSPIFTRFTTLRFTECKRKNCLYSALAVRCAANVDWIATENIFAIYNKRSTWLPKCFFLPNSFPRNFTKMIAIFS